MEVEVGDRNLEVQEIEDRKLEVQVIKDRKMEVHTVMARKSALLCREDSQKRKSGMTKIVDQIPQSMNLVKEGKSKKGEK